MNKFYLAMMCVAATGATTAQNKLDFNARQAMEAYESRLHFAAETENVANVRSLADTETRAILVALKSAANAADLEALGYEVENLFGDIALINIPLSEVNALAEHEFVVQISFGGEAHLLMDKARAGSNVDVIQDGTGAGLNNIPYTGKGVAVGVYDTGLDPNHINFRGRVKGIFRAKGTSGTVASVTNASSISKFTTDNTGETHGTHVLGIAAGGYNGLGNVAGTDKPADNVNVPYYGVATGADLLVGCGDLYNECILKGVTAIIDEAEKLGKPAVINLSLGTNTGAHDGMDAFGRSLDALAKDAIIVVAAGNEGDLPMGLTKRLTAEDNTVKTFPVPYVASTGANFASEYSGTIEIYANDNQPFTCRIVTTTRRGEIIDEYVLNSSTSGKSTTLGGSSTGASYIKLNEFDAATSADSYLSISSNVDTYSKRYGVTITHALKMASSRPSAYLGIIIEGKAGQLINFYGNTTSTLKNRGVYSTFIERDLEDWDAGSCNGSINSMACGKNLLVVGSWNTRSSWYNLGGGRGGYDTSAAYAVGNVSGFSSYGTIYDGTNLPHVLAPGCGIISSVSNYYTGLGSDKQLLALVNEDDRKNPYDYMQGTSMATPFVTGTVALWLEADPTLTVADVKDIAMATAVKDSYTAKADPVQVGAGKLDALAGLKEVLRRAHTGIDAVVDDAASQLIVEAKGDNLYSIFMGGASNLSATVYSLAGQQIARLSDNGDELMLDLSGVQKGVYVVDVNSAAGRATTKILVK